MQLQCLSNFCLTKWPKEEICFEIHHQFSTQIIIKPNLDLNCIQETERIMLNTAIQRGEDANEVSAWLRNFFSVKRFKRRASEKEIRIQGSTFAERM